MKYVIVSQKKVLMGTAYILASFFKVYLFPFTLGKYVHKPRDGDPLQ